MKECPRRILAPDTGCDLGHLDRSKCPAWKGQTVAAEYEHNGDDEILLPWSGSALGLVDLGFIAGRAKPIVVGTVGPENAGKTTLLAWYLLLGRGLGRSQNRRFAGSYSLAGWEAVASALRWSPGNQPSFPPHNRAEAAVARLTALGIPARQRSPQRLSPD